MKLNLLVLLWLSSIPIYGQEFTNNTIINITKNWSQEPGGYTYPLFVHVPNTTIPEGGFPACILLHGNGGQGEGMRNTWRNDLGQTHILVAPSGYLKSWNITEETSNAPDVEMINDLIDSLQKFTNINPNKIRLLGSSNGSALANRILIENKDNGIDLICGIVSQLTEASYHNGEFYLPSGETGDNGTNNPAFEGYDTPTTPITGRKYLNVGNTNDGIIPYYGGNSVVGTNFLDAQYAAYVVAQSQGYIGSQIMDASQIGGVDVYEFSYLDDQVVHLQGNAMHGLNETQRAYIIDYFNNSRIITSTQKIIEDDLGKVKIFPNPTHSAIRIEHNYDKSLGYTLYSILGHKIKQGVLTKNIKQIDLGFLPANTYLLKIDHQVIKILKLE